MKKFIIFLTASLLLFGSGCRTRVKKLYESRYQAAYEYINNRENLTFWKNDICDEKYKNLFPVNIIPDILGGGDASGFKPLINYIFYPNKNSDIYVIFSREYNNYFRAYVVQTDDDLYPHSYMMVATDLPIHDFAFTFIFNEDNSIKYVWPEIGYEY